MPMRLPTNVCAWLERLVAGAKPYPSDHAMLVLAVETHLAQTHRDGHGVIVFTRGWM